MEDLEDIDEEEYEEIPPNMQALNECQVVSLQLPNSLTQSFLVDQSSDTLAKLKEKLTHCYEEEIKRRRSLSIVNVSALVFAFPREGKNFLISPELEVVPIESLLESINVSLTNECLELMMIDRNLAFEEIMIKKPGDLIRVIVQITITEETSYKLLIIRKTDTTEMILASLINEEEIFLPLKDIKNIELKSDLQLLVFPNEDIAMFVVTFSDPFDLQDTMKYLDLQTYQHEKASTSRHFLVKKINRFRIRQKRLLWIQDELLIMNNVKLSKQKFHDLRNISQFVKVGRKGKKLSINFSDPTKRDIVLVFYSSEEFEEFYEVVQESMDSLRVSKFHMRDTVMFKEENSSSSRPRVFSWFNEKPEENTYKVIQVTSISMSKRYLELMSNEVAIKKHDGKLIRKLPLEEIKIEDSDINKLIICAGNQVLSFIFHSVYFKYHFICSYKITLNPHIPIGQVVLRPINVFVGTWNIGRNASLPNLFKFIERAPYHDIVAIGLQECKINRRTLCLSAVNHFFEGHNFTLLSFVSMWEMLMVVYVKKDKFEEISEVKNMRKATGIANILGNKGGLLVSFKLSGSMFTFVSCHLAARESRIQQRNQNIKDLLGLRPGKLDCDFTIESDFTFWFGDLNYRIQEEFEIAVDQISNENLSCLWDQDQLKNQIAKNQILTAFTEEKLNFNPTYRYERFSCEWSNKKGQTPSWTDRILLRAHKDFEVKNYQAVYDCQGSDHRPVIGSFNLTLTDWLIAENLSDLDPRFAVIEFEWLELTFSQDAVSEYIKLSMYSPFMQKVYSTSEVEIENSTIRFESKQLPMLTWVFPYLHFLKQQRIIITVKSVSQEPKKLSQGSLSLESLVDAYRDMQVDYSKSYCSIEGSDFEVELENETRVCGVLKGRWIYNLCSQSELTGKTYL